MLKFKKASMAEVSILLLYHVKIKSIRSLVVFLGFSLILALHATSSSAQLNTRCNQNQFTCPDGSCILLEKMCDGRHDCSGGSDEMDCEFKKCRRPDWFQCTKPHGPCLSMDLVCNGVENCPGGDDELDCVSGLREKGYTSFDIGWHSYGPNCSIYEYTCMSDKSCIPLDFMCDGKNDCRDGSDEVAGCLQAEAKCTGFFCSNKKCLESSKWICDGVDDCGDGSDEEKCIEKCKPELNKFLCKDNSTCLDLNKVCNGNNDCPDNSDESSNCKDNCKTNSCTSGSKCQVLPTGSTCLCPMGWRYSETAKLCVDINECTENFDICSQRCVNTVGSYRCSCDKGFDLRSDNRTCRAQGEEALLLYTTQVAIMGVHLRSKKVFTVAKNLTKVIGVSFDGDNIYWTNIQREQESIVRAKADGSNQEILLTSGLDAPEDLAVDWLTNNIYFSDNVMRHIAVCSKNAETCAVLVTIDVHQPRGIALWPERGQMFWTDWGRKPMIARASMDGLNTQALITENIEWPNGIALDMHNDRIYWLDAKLATIESSRSDGTDRRNVIADILKHPYGLGIFEENIYWSDWGTKSIHTCDKFTGKNHKIITKDRVIYAVHIYHSSKQPKTDHACMRARCSHLCLLAENNTFSCACPDGMQLSKDHRQCTKTHKKQRLFIGVRNTLLEMDHTTFGRHTISQTHDLPMYISEMAYNSVNGSIFIADNVQRAIYEYDMINNKINTLVHNNLGNISGIAFDHLSYNLYWTDSERHSVEVLSLKTLHRAVVNFISGMEKPIGLAIVPDEGTMFIALRSRQHVHIDEISLNGDGDHKHAFEDDLGRDDIKFATDYDSNTLYWSDSSMGHILFSNYHSLQALTFRGHINRPYSLAIVGDDLFWSELRSPSIYWTHKSNFGPLKRIEIEAKNEGYSGHMLPVKIPVLGSTPALIVDHPCQHLNGGCSHICVTLGKFAGACLCPPGLVFKDSSNRTCIEALDCEFRCRSGECLTQSHRCNDRKDCKDGSDEEACSHESGKLLQVTCAVSEFKCHDGTQCIKHSDRCNGIKNCHDNSDEIHCDKFDKSKMCHHHQHACKNGNCVDVSVMCDGTDDCGDNSDEENCAMSVGNDTSTRPTCVKDMFQCNTGTCIAKSWECDGKIDCTDSSDEHDKCGVKECPTNMHKCMLGQCIDARLVCDQHNDCGDFSDEVNCDYSTGKKLKFQCGDEHHSKYQCPSDGNICLELSAKCNGTTECSRGEDEADCGTTCGFYEFQCKKSKECIRIEFHCDHEKDCPDGSDEQNCKYNDKSNDTLLNTHERPCDPNMFHCKNGQCVDMSRVCNGFPDCDTEADEGPLCKTACLPTSGKPTCDQKCRATPTGAICSCRKGFKLDSDNRSCLDVNECNDFDPCAQLCENTHGSYRCSCYPDFMLRADKTTCKSIESNSSLMFSTYNEVRSLSEQPIMLQIKWTTNDSRINGFDLNIRKRRAYFTTDTEDALYKVNVETGAITAGLAVKMPTKVAVDWIADTVYVISRSQNYEIKVCSFSAKMCGLITQAKSRETIKTLAVDAFNRKLFYVIIRAKSFGQPISQIIISNLDGSRREILLKKNGGFISAIAVDPHKKLLYFVDFHSKSLEAISYKLGSSRTPKVILQKSKTILQPSGLTVHENQAFIVNIGSKEAIRCQLYGDHSCRAFNLNILNAEDILVDGASRQPLNTNPCLMAKCNGMCIQSEYGYECMCGNKIVSESTICSEDTSNEILSSALLTPTDSDSSTHSHSAAIWFWSLLLLAIIAAIAGYMYYRHIKQGHRDFNISLHFQNPLASLGKPTKSFNNNTSNLARSASSAEQMESNKPNCRFFRSSTTNSDSEIMLETAKAPEIRAMGQGRQMSNIMVDDDFDYDTARPNGSCKDDARTRLVP